MLNYIPCITEYKLKRYCNAICTYCGGKSRIFNYIAFLIYKMKVETVIELCAGSAYVSLNLKVTHKVINDVSLSLSVIYKALSIPDITDVVLCRLKNTEYSEKVFKAAVEYWEMNKNKSLSEFEEEDLCNAAYHSWILRAFSRIGSQISTKFIDTKEQRNDFVRLQKHLIQYYHKLDNALVLNENLLRILQWLVDNPDNIKPNTLVYLDPPYLESKKRGVNSNGVYNEKFTIEEHKKMLELADKLPRDKCKVIISGYDDAHGLYDTVLNEEGVGEWYKIFVKELPVQYGNKGDKKKGTKCPREDEYFFTNFKPE